MERIGNYRVERRLAGGGGRERYEATHCVLPRRALIQVAAPEAALQLMREACFLEALDHPGIVRVFESGLLAHRRPWLASERVEGFTLERVLQRDALDPADVTELVRDLAETLAHAHRRGIVHGGLRPDRIVLTGHPRRFPVCLVDWSDARAHDAGPIARSVAPDGHEAPELVRGDAIDDRADVYALGLIAYEALTGGPVDDAVPIAVDDEGEVIAAASCCPDAPRALTALVDQMLAFDRWDRPSAAEVHLELASLSAALETHVPPDAPAPIYIRKPRWTPQLPFRELDPADFEEDGPIVRGSD